MSPLKLVNTTLLVEELPSVTEKEFGLVKTKPKNA